MKKNVSILIIALVTTFFTSQVFSAQNGLPTTGAEQAAEQLVAKININTAGESTLSELPGVGPKIAERIQRYRQQHGPFQSIEELLNVKGIGPKVLTKIRPQATLS